MKGRTRIRLAQKESLTGLLHMGSINRTPKLCGVKKRWIKVFSDTQGILKEWRTDKRVYEGGLY